MVLKKTRRRNIFSQWNLEKNYRVKQNHRYVAVLLSGITIIKAFVTIKIL